MTVEERMNEPTTEKKVSEEYKSLRHYTNEKGLQGILKSCNLYARRYNAFEDVY